MRAETLASKIKKGRSLIDNLDQTPVADKETIRLENNLMTKKYHSLTVSEVVNVLIKKNLSKYKKFVFTKRQALLDSCWGCFVRCGFQKKGLFTSRKREKFHILYKAGQDRLMDSLDVRRIIKAQQTLDNVIKL